MQQFRLGQVVATSRALLVLGNESALPYLARHACGDWGDVSEEDRAQNDEGVREGGTLHSAYTTAGGVKIWIITEWDRSVTTVLLPEDY